MIQSQIILKVLDNSGISFVKCISINKKPFQKFGKVGVSFLGVIIKFNKKKLFKNKYKKGDLVRCFFICSKKENQFSSSGIFLKNFTKNGAIILSSKNQKDVDFIPLGTR